MQTIRTLALAFVMAAGPATASTVNVVTNGGFEDGATGFFTDFTQGQLGSVSRYDVVGTTSGLAPHSGTQYLFVNGNNTPSSEPTSWAQTVQLIAGNLYSFSAWMADWSGVNPKAILSVRIDGTEFTTMTAPATQDTWAQFTGSFTAHITGTATLSFVELTSAFGGNDYGLDDISLTTSIPSAVPLPAGLPLLLAGMGALALVRRRRV